ncbi:hypothetical protein KQH29_00830 [bacterium]|nr:hypothetical protein [bacterium]
MKIQNQCERCQAEVALIDGKPVLRLYADGVLSAQMDAGRIQKVTILPTGRARVVMIPTPSPVISAADYGLVFFDASGRVSWPKS